MQDVLITFAEAFGLMMILKFLPRPLQRLKFAWRHLAERRALCIVLAGVIPVLLHLAFYPRPEPALHDEFAYLLQADTFAHGRWANSPRPLWEHFEQFHVISQPVFAAKYQPLPAALLAVGQMAGDPYYGVLLSAALTFSAAMWMLYGWFPPSYALLGWVIALTRWGPGTYWMNSFWGGLVAALGGVLVIGAWPRLRKAVTARDSILLGVGMVVLAASRPYEGLVLSAAACIALLVVNRQAWRSVRWTAPVLAAGAAVLLYYNFKVTGDARVLPYVMHDRAYAAAGNFFFIPPKAAPPVYRHPEFQTLFGDWFLKDYGNFHAHPWRSQFSKLESLVTFYCGGWPLTLALVCAPLAFASRRLRWALILLVMFLAGLALLTQIFPHYASPAAGLFVIAQVGGLHCLRRWNPQGRPTGSLVARVAMLATGVLFAAAMIHKPTDYTTGDASFKALRKSLTAQLTAIQGRHLVLVHYAPDHNPYMDFVVNGAEFDQQRVLWARSMGAEEDGRLIQYFRDRQIWAMEGDAILPQLRCVVSCGSASQAQTARGSFALASDGKFREAH
jgi:hypothetical protein